MRHYPPFRTKNAHKKCCILMLEYVWNISLNFLTSMGVSGMIKIRDKKGQNPGGKEKKRQKSKIWAFIGVKPLAQRTDTPVSIYSGPPLTLYLRPDGEEVESNISSLIMVSDMRLSRRGPAALPPIPCIIITEWRCRDAEMRRCGDAGQHRYFDVGSPLVPTGPLPTLPCRNRN